LKKNKKKLLKHEKKKKKVEYIYIYIYIFFSAMKKTDVSVNWFILKIKASCKWLEFFILLGKIYRAREVFFFFLNSI
jgi:hypothetical protein